MLIVAGTYTCIAVAGTPAGIDEHPVTYVAADWLTRSGLIGSASPGERNDDEPDREGRSGHDSRTHEKPAPRRASERPALTAHSAVSLNATAGTAAWHSKQSIFTETYVWQLAQN